MKISARNMLPGRVMAVIRGPVGATVKIQMEGGGIITASITADAADDLGLEMGDKVSAIIKSSDVIIAK